MPKFSSLVSCKNDLNAENVHGGQGITFNSRYTGEFYWAERCPRSRSQNGSVIGEAISTPEQNTCEVLFTVPVDLHPIVLCLRKEN
jgi:hypothetical protein